MHWIYRWLVYMLIVIGILTVIGPFVYMFLTSLTADNYRLPSPETLLQQAKTLENYMLAWTQNSFARYFSNSLFITFTTLFFSLALSSITAYAFARFPFPGKEVLFKIFIFTMIIPTLINIIPQFTIIKTFGLVDTYTGLILLYVATGVAGNTFFLRGFFEQIPTELEESIFIDGGNRWTIYRAIYVPLSLPALGTLGIFIFNSIWEEFVLAVTLIKTEDHRTVPVALQLFRGQNATQYGRFFAASIIALIPTIIIFLLFQKQFVNPKMEGSLKG